MTASLEFENLPLVEAALRTSFRSPLPLRFSVLNELHSNLASEFRNLEVTSQFEAAPGMNLALPSDVGPIPGAVLSGHEQGLRVTLQQHLVVTRWIRQPYQSAPPYPRYAAISECHWQVAHALLKATKVAEPECAAVNMSYVNFLAVEEGANFLFEYFSPQAHVELVRGGRLLHKYELAWQTTGAVDLRIRLERARLAFGDEQKEGYNLTTVGGMGVTTLTDAKTDLETAHGQLQEFFGRLISDRAKDEWRLRNASA